MFFERERKKWVGLFFCRLSRIGDAEKLFPFFETVSLGADLGLDVQVDRFLNVLLELGNFLGKKMLLKYTFLGAMTLSKTIVIMTIASIMFFQFNIPTTH